ncbi:MAG: hypothetical protein FWF82_01460 [Oscillospiraceae bacterium]|nr:hypothetical protein [Oscillospiraceae bacterium]
MNTLSTITDTVFENQYTRTKEFYEEYYKRIHIKNRWFIFFNICVLGSIISNLVSWIFFKGDSDLLIELVVIFSVLWILKIVMYKSEKVLRYEQDLKLCGGFPFEICMTVTDSGLDYSVKNYQTKTHFDFSQLKRVKKTGEFFVITAKSTFPFIFKSDSFSKGNPDEFLTFLKQKGL